MHFLNKLKENYDGSAVVYVMGLVVVIVVLVVVVLIFHKKNNQSTPTNSSATTTTSPQPSTSPSTAYAVLPPATVAPKVAECSQAISYASNGDSGPISCSSGGLNVTEWQALSTLEPTVMGLGSSATEQQVQNAICNDVHENVSNPIEQTVYQISVLYYGWSFSTNPSAVLSNGTCTNVDD